MLTAELLDALLRWAQNGERNVTIKFGGQKEPEVWVYDVALGSGKFLKQGDPLDFDAELLEKAIEHAEARVTELKAMTKREEPA